MNKKEILMQPNNLIKSKYDFTLIENKLFYKILFNAQKQSNNKPIYHAILSQDEIRSFIKYRNDSTEESIKKMLNLFQQSILEFDYIDEHGNLRTFGSGLINTYDINKNTMEYEITMHETLYNHITDFIRMEDRGYTPLNLSVLFKFRGAYAQRFYTFFRLWSREKREIEVKYSIKEIREYLKIADDIYPAYKNFKQKVLKKSIDEINEVGNMRVEVKEEIKKGRKVDEIVFKVIDFEPRKYFGTQDNEVTEPKDIKIETEVSKEISITDVEVIDMYVPNKQLFTSKTLATFQDNEVTEPKDIKIETEVSKEISITDVEVIDMYVPNKQLFTSKTLATFQNDFFRYNFKDTNIKNKFYEAIGTTLEKDDTEKIYVKSYNYFKKTLENKLNELSVKENENEFKKTKFHNFDETFTRYSDDEFENIVLESQKKKFGNKNS